MKNIFNQLVVIALTVLVVACGLSCQCKTTKTPEEPDALLVTPEHRDFNFTGDGITAYTDAGASFMPTFQVSTNMTSWDAVSDQSWLTVTRKENTFRLSVAANAGDGPFEQAKVTVATGPSGPTEIVTVRKDKDNALDYSGYAPAGSWLSGGIIDLALIFNGDNRTGWTQEAFKNYLTWTNPDTQKEEWLFDGFLFTEGECNGFQFTYSGSQPATKENTLFYLDNCTFVKNRAIDALDQAVGAAIQRLGTPPRPRRVVLMVSDPPPPEVNPRLTNWGELNGKTVDLNNPDDRFAAVKWYIDQAMDRWERAGYQNIELAGFYWVRENVYSWAYDYSKDLAFVKRCVQYIHSLGMRAFWCPYWDAKGSGAWKEMGFDVAYQQPNHQFDLKVPDSRVAEACNFAKSHGMGLEVEWQKELFLDPETYARRLWVNLDTFEEYDVLQDAAMMHYMGATVPGSNLPYALNMLSESTDQRLIDLYRHLCSILAERQKKYAVKVK